MLNTTLLLAALAAPQEPPQQPLPEGQEIPHDFVVGIAGNELVLRTDLDLRILTDADLRARIQAATTIEEQLEVQFEALSSRLENLIMVQAGADIGFDPELVEQLTDREFGQKIESFGGHRMMSEMLQQRMLTPERYRVQIRDQLLSESWRRSRIGTAPGPTGRVSVDRYIRPGVMRMYYDAFIDSKVPREREAVGIVDAQVRVQLLQVNVPAGGVPEAVLTNVENLVATYQAGDASFEGLINVWGDESSREQRGITSAGNFDRLGRLRHGSTDLARLVHEGEIGDVTEPQWAEMRGADGISTRQAWCVYRLAERIAAVPPRAFGARQLQEQLRTYLLEMLDAQREDAAFTGALKDTHVWPDEHRQVILVSRAKKRGR